MSSQQELEQELYEAKQTILQLQHTVKELEGKLQEKDKINEALNKDIYLLSKRVEDMHAEMSKYQEKVIEMIDDSDDEKYKE